MNVTSSSWKLYPFHINSKQFQALNMLYRAITIFSVVISIVAEVVYLEPPAGKNGADHCMVFIQVLLLKVNLPRARLFQLSNTFHCLKPSNSKFHSHFTWEFHNLYRILLFRRWFTTPFWPWMSTFRKIAPKYLSDILMEEHFCKRKY